MKRFRSPDHYPQKNMGRLIVQTLTDGNCVTAFVASAEGRPSLGLGLENFRVRSTVPGADGANLVITSVGASNLRGFYVLDLAPTAQALRRRGLYVFDLIVEDGEDHGQTLSSVILA